MRILDWLGVRLLAGRTLEKLADAGNAVVGTRKLSMSYTLEAFCDDCKMNADAGKAGREKIRHNMERLLADQDFVAAYFGPDAEPGITVVYSDDETDVQVLTHVYAEGKESPPHDHGESWAVYGQAVAHTDMTVWRRLDTGEDADHAEVEPTQSYRLEPAMAGTFEPGEIHSIRFPPGARFLRVTGADLKKIPTRRYDPAGKSVLEGAGVSGVVR
jgi:predicted metal-dependent enzyme (double-stranded beta helix superfamily)